MQNPTMVMSKASRMIINQLDKLAMDSGVQGLTIPAHIYMCDYMIIKYNQSAVMNIIRSHIAKIPKVKREFKHFTPIYWYKIVDNMLGNNESVKYDIDGEVYGEMQDYNSFNYIIRNFLQSDYSIQEAIRINKLVNTVDQSSIVSACKVAAQNNVYNMAYVEAVIQSDQQRKKCEEIKHQAIIQRAQESSDKLRMDVHQHTPVELAEMEYNYEEKRNNILLTLMVKKLLDGDKK